jgi:hypothetical protein
VKGEKVGSLCSALENKRAARVAWRQFVSLIETILLEPDGDQLKITEG